MGADADVATLTKENSSQLVTNNQGSFIVLGQY